MGLYAGVMKEEQKRDYSDRELLIRYVKRVSPYRRSILLISLFIFVASIAEILNPLAIGITVDELSKINKLSVELLKLTRETKLTKLV